jgi:hypothetical protein
MSWWTIDGVRVPASRPGASDGPVDGPERAWLAGQLGLAADDVVQVVVQRRSLDGRSRPPQYEFRVLILVRQAAGEPRLGRRAGAWRLRSCDPPAPPVLGPARRSRAPGAARPVIVGAGPAGLFAALDLALRGVPALVLERGAAVDLRRQAVARFRHDGVLDPDSNLVFGEGGAGAYSDGKIYTRSDGELPQQVLRWLVDLGAPADILIDARPHLGTDRLARLLTALRQRLVELGVQLRFGATVTGVETTAAGALAGLTLAGGELVPANAAIVAIGHHARDTIAALARSGLELQAWPTAIGVRIEHPQALVDRWLYGRESRGELPAASYRVALKPRTDRPRAVYSFCMCPGGVVVAAPERDGLVVTNGMSGSRRSGRYANAALVVPVGHDDYAAHGDPDDPLRGIRFVEAVERAAFEAGGGGFVAPVQRAADLAAGRPTEDAPRCTYHPGVAPADLRQVLPEPVWRSLRSALVELDRRWRGFAGADAAVIGVETRTSSPVRLLRDESGQATAVSGLYPAGEGAGYAGGILSAAADGQVE